MRTEIAQVELLHNDSLMKKVQKYEEELWAVMKELTDQGFTVDSKAKSS